MTASAGMTPSRESRPAGVETGLYRFFDTTGALLYVGIANDPWTRWSSHAGDKRWWGEVELKTIDWFTTRGEAEQAEIAAIVKERPRYNVTHSETRQPGDAQDESTGRYGFIARLRWTKGSWERFGQATKAAGTNRSAVIVAFIHWYIRLPGARLPKRPPSGPWSARTS